MRTGSNALNEALRLGHRSYDVQVRLGGRDVTDEVDSWSVGRSWDTSLPDQIAVPSGSSAAEAQISLSGSEGGTAASRYSPWAPRDTADVTRPGQSCVLEWGLAEERMQSLRGRVRGVQASSRTGQAQVEALDGAELLRGQAWLPPAAMAGTVGGPLHAQWVLDHALRESGVYASPPMRDSAIFFASMNGSREANRGMSRLLSGGVGFSPERSPWTAGPVAGPGLASWWGFYAPQRRVLTQQNTLLVEWWVYRRDTDDNFRSTVEMIFADRAQGDTGTRTTTRVLVEYLPGDGELRARVNNSDVSWSLPSSANQAGRFKVIFQVGFTTSSNPVAVQGNLYQPNGSLYSSGGFSGPSPAWGVLDEVYVGGTGPMECVGVSQIVGSPSLVPTWQRGAELNWIPQSGVDADTQDHRLSALPDVSGSWWDLIKSLAEANMAYVGFDEDGVFRAHRLDYTRPSNPPNVAHATVTAAREISELDASEDIDSVANRVAVGVTPYSRSGTTLRNRVVYTTPREIPGAQSTALQYNADSRLWGCPTPMLFRGNTRPPVEDARSVVKLLSETGGYPPVEVELRWDGNYPTVVYHNRSSNPAFIVMDTTHEEGSLGLGYADVESVQHHPQVRLMEESIDVYGVQSLEIGASDWVQSPTWANEISGEITRWTAWPMPITGTVEILPDPRIQQGDVVRIVDAEGVRIDGMYRVVGYEISGQGPDVRMTLDVRPMSRPERPEDARVETEPVLDPAVTDSFPG